MGNLKNDRSIAKLEKINTKVMKEFYCDISSSVLGNILCLPCSNPQKMLFFMACCIKINIHHTCQFLLLNQVHFQSLSVDNKICC